MFHVLAATLLTLIFGLPVLGLSELASVLPNSPAVRTAFLILCPVLYALGFVLTAGLMSLPFHGSIVAGSFRRDLSDPAYRNRRIYGLCWTAVFYFTPIYWMFLTVPPLKTLLFRLFGYRGQMKFTVYPDTWIRDLPLLEFGEGAYIANKSTIGTNVCLNDGTILVDRVSLGKGAMVGHMTMLAPGVVMEEGAEVGVGTALGMRARLGAGVSIGACSQVGHLVRMEAGSSTGSSVDVGAGSRIGPRIHLPGGTFVPKRTKWNTAEEMRAALSAGEPNSAPSATPEARRSARARRAAADRAAPEGAVADGDVTRFATANGASAEFRLNWNAFE